jgi:hypothetical protein
MLLRVTRANQQRLIRFWIEDISCVGFSCFSSFHNFAAGQFAEYVFKNKKEAT